MEVITPAPRGIWQEVLAADPAHLESQSPAWVDAITAMGRYFDASRAYVFPSGTTAVLPAVGVARGPMTRVWSMPPAWGMGGLISSEPLTRGLVQSVLRDVSRAGNLAFSVRPNPLNADAWKAAADLALEIERRAHVIDLRGGFEEVWNDRMSRGARKRANRADRLGVEVSRSTNGEGLEVFYALFQQSLERWARRQNEPRAMALWRGRRRDPLAKFQRMAEALGEAFRLWIASVDGRPAAAIIVTQGANAHYTRGVVDEELSGRTEASYLLQVRAIEDACRAGCAAYHMGESGSSRGLAEFKERLGAHSIPYAEYRLERLPVTRVDTAARTAVKKLIGFRDA